jgi:hypothetical protein
LPICAIKIELLAIFPISVWVKEPLKVLFSHVYAVDYPPLFFFTVNEGIGIPQRVLRERGIFVSIFVLLLVAGVTLATVKIDKAVLALP